MPRHLLEIQQTKTAPLSDPKPVNIDVSSLQILMNQALIAQHLTIKN
jgi:hypothetical protein